MKTYCGGNIWKIFILALSFQLIFSPASFAQEKTAGANRNFKRNVATVLFSSLGGAVLGLSTLSFYGKPQEHTNNITTGALIGFVAGLGYVAYSSSQPKPATYDYSFSETDLKLRRGSVAVQNPTLLQLQFEFE